MIDTTLLCEPQHSSHADRTSRRRLLRAGALLFPVLWAFPSAAQLQDAKLIDVRLAVPGPGSAVSLPLELAISLGFDRLEGINLHLKFVAGGAVAINDIQAGDAEFGVFGLPAAMAAHLQDNQLVALAAVEDLPVWVMMVRADLKTSVRKITDLRGKRIGVHSNSLANKTMGDLITELAISSHGIPLTDARLVSAGQSWESQTAALQSGSVDALMTDEPIASRMTNERIAYPIFSTADPDDLKETPGLGALRATLIGRSDRIQFDATSTVGTVRIIKHVLSWMTTHTSAQIADQLKMKGDERKSFIAVSEKYPRRYSNDAKFSNQQLAQTEIFFRASEADNPSAQRFSVNTMVIDRWAGRKP